MIRFLPLLTLLFVLEACQSTARRADYRKPIADKNLGPRFDDPEVPDPSSTPKKDTDSVQTGGKNPRQETGTTDSHFPESEVISSAKVSGNPNLPFGLPVMTGGEKSWIIARPQYVLSWNPDTKNPNWVAWKLSSSDLGTIGRQDNFTVDPELDAYLRRTQSTIRSVTSSDYTGQCFDRGHVVPSSERQASSEDNIATFYTTNIMPQSAFLNQKIWKSLEDQTKEWMISGEQKNLWIVAGPTYDQPLHFIGPQKNIAIPSGSYKLVYSWDEEMKDKPFLLKAILVPNMTSQGTLAYADREQLCAESRSGGSIKSMPVKKSIVYEDYETTVQEIEAAAHVKFPEWD